MESCSIMKVHVEVQSLIISDALNLEFVLYFLCWLDQVIVILLSNVIFNSGETFVTRKITRAVAKIHLGLQDKVC